MGFRKAQVDRLLEAERTRASEYKAGRGGGQASREAQARFSSARRNASREEWDEFIGLSTDDAIGTSWRDGR